MSSEKKAQSGILSWIGVSPSPVKSKGTSTVAGNVPTIPQPQPGTVVVNPDTILSAIVPQFVKSMPPKSESGKQPKSDLKIELGKRCDRLCQKLRAGFEKNKVVDDHHINEVCSRLRDELEVVVEAYFKSITESAVKLAREKMKEVVPKDPGEVGISLPALSNAKLEDAIEKKRRSVLSQFTKQVEKFDASWYINDESVEFVKTLDIWASCVRGK